jgi:hypothetical protein
MIKQMLPMSGKPGHWQHFWAFFAVNVRVLGTLTALAIIC